MLQIVAAPRHRLAADLVVSIEVEMAVDNAKVRLLPQLSDARLPREEAFQPPQLRLSLIASERAGVDSIRLRLQVDGLAPSRGVHG